MDGRYKKDISIQVSDNMEKSPMSFEDSIYLFAFKKTKKLTVALYLVSNLIKDNEPVKWRMREKGLCLLSTIVFLKTGQDSNGHSMSGHDITGTSHALVEEIVALLEIARTACLLSEMNALILTREYTALGRFLEERGSELIVHGRARVSEDFLDVPEPESPTSPTDILKDTSKRQTEGASFRKGMSYMSKKDKNEAGAGGRANKVLRNTTNDRFKNRKNIILNLIGQKRRVNIKDISEVIHDCSEKTIQRDLIAMVGQGILKKEGERRWSTYLLV